MKKRIMSLALGLSVIASVTQAAEDVRLGGFIRAAGAVTDVADSKDKYMERINNNASYGDTHFGLNISAAINDNWSVAGQLYASGAEENYNISLDWAYASYRPNDNFSVDMGKMKYPNLVVSEYYDVGITYPWIRPPEEIYRFEVLGPSLSYEAISGFKLNAEGYAGEMEYAFNIYAGATALEAESMGEMTGIVASLSSDTFTIKAAHNTSTLDLTANSERESSMHDKTQSVTSVGMTLDVANVIGYAEYATGEVQDHAEYDLDAWYVTVGYRAGAFLPHITIAQFEHENKLGQESVAIGLKYTITPSSSFKVEYKTIEPKERVDTEPGENPAGFFEDVPSESEVNLISVAYDVVF